MYPLLGASCREFTVCTLNGCAAQASYLPMLEYVAGGSDAVFLDPCQNCTSGPVTIPEFPFGKYFHTTAYVSE